MDAVDCMGFCNVGDDVPKDAVEFFVKVLEQCYGGKNLLTVPVGLVGEFSKLGFATVSSGNQRLMSVDPTGLDAKLAKAPGEQMPVDFLLKKDLISRVAELSNLFADAPFAAGDKGPLYCEKAMQWRISNDKVYVVAAAVRNEIIGFMRVYKEKGFVYVSDWVVKNGFRTNGVAKQMLHKAYQDLKEQLPSLEKIFLIAGSDDDVRLYQDKFGGDRNLGELLDHRVFMYRFIPQPENGLLFNLKDALTKSMVDDVASAPVGQPACRP